MRILEISSCLVSQSEPRSLRSALQQHVSWFVVATRVSSHRKQTRAAPNTSAGSAKVPLPGSRLRQGLVTVSSLVPRRALEIQPFRGGGPVPDSKRRAHPFAADVSPGGAGDAVKGVLVMARLDARAAIAPVLRFVVSRKGHGPGANQTQRGRACDAWRVTGSMSDTCLSLSARTLPFFRHALLALGPWCPS